MLVDAEKVGQDAYKLYCGLIKGGFTEGHALSIISQSISHLLMQNILREEAEAKRICEEIG